MDGENRPLVTYEPVEFAEKPVEIRDFRKFTDWSRGIYRIYLKLIKKNQEMSTCNQLDLGTLESLQTLVNLTHRRIVIHVLLPMYSILGTTLRSQDKFLV